jgi:hypothetical protein
VYGRLRAGVSRAAAEAQMDAALEQANGGMESIHWILISPVSISWEK